MSHTQDPAWLQALMRDMATRPSELDALTATVRIAEASVTAGGGPFGALVVDHDGRVVSAGWNQVIATHDSTAHAEIVAIRTAQHRLATHDLAAAEGAPFTLYASCAPCIQCFGALYWSGVARVVAGAPKELAEAVGFDEGPVSDALWDTAARDKGLRYELAALGDDVARRPFDTYRRVGGAVY